MRLSALTARKFSISRRAAKEAIRKGFVTLNGEKTAKDVEVAETDDADYCGSLAVPIIDIEKYLIYKDKEVCFLYKPPFMHFERLRPDDPATLSDVMLALPEYRAVSRLDYGADGVIGAIASEKKVIETEKRYLAWVCGDFPREFTASWTIDAAKRTKVRALDDSGGHPALMRKLRFNGKYSLISVTLEKAARHQVRAFCAKAGYPILGDDLYGGEPFERLCLHCEKFLLNGREAASGKFASVFAAVVDKKENRMYNDKIFGNSGEEL